MSNSPQSERSPVPNSFLLIPQLDPLNLVGIRMPTVQRSRINAFHKELLDYLGECPIERIQFLGASQRTDCYLIEAQNRQYTIAFKRTPKSVVAEVTRLSSPRSETRPDNSNDIPSSTLNEDRGQVIQFSLNTSDARKLRGLIESRMAEDISLRIYGLCETIELAAAKRNLAYLWNAKCAQEVGRLKVNGYSSGVEYSITMPEAAATEQNPSARVEASLKFNTPNGHKSAPVISNRVILLAKQSLEPLNLRDVQVLQNGDISFSPHIRTEQELFALVRDELRNNRAHENPAINEARRAIDGLHSLAQRASDVNSLPAHYLASRLNLIREFEPTDVPLLCEIFVNNLNQDRTARSASHDVMAPQIPNFLSKPWWDGLALFLRDHSSPKARNAAKPLLVDVLQNSKEICLEAASFLIGCFRTEYLHGIAEVALMRTRGRYTEAPWAQLLAVDLATHCDSDSLLPLMKVLGPDEVRAVLAASSDPNAIRTHILKAMAKPELRWFEPHADPNWLCARACEIIRDPTVGSVTEPIRFSVAEALVHRAARVPELAGTLDPFRLTAEPADSQPKPRATDKFIQALWFSSKPEIVALRTDLLAKVSNENYSQLVPITASRPSISNEQGAFGSPMAFQESLELLVKHPDLTTTILAASLCAISDSNWDSVMRIQSDLTPERWLNLLMCFHPDDPCWKSPVSESKLVETLSSPETFSANDCSLLAHRFGKDPKTARLIYGVARNKRYSVSQRVAALRSLLALPTEDHLLISWLTEQHRRAQYGSRYLKLGAWAKGDPELLKAVHTNWQHFASLFLRAGR